PQKPNQIPYLLNKVIKEVAKIKSNFDISLSFSKSQIILLKIQLRY
ncbi:unnamed protein product, partial [marine sediment metagenome]